MRAVAVLIALVLVLSGCSLVEDGEHVFNDVQRGFVAQQKLDELTNELRTRSDVAKAEAGAAPVYQTAKVIVLMHEDAAPGAISEVVTLIDDTLRSAELQPMNSEFELTAGNASIRHTDFTQARIDYAAELSYWGAVMAAVGSTMSLTLAPDQAGTFQRTLEANADEAVIAMAEHVDALKALTPPNNTNTSWMLPGIAGATDWPLPEGKILAFLATMAGITNLLDDTLAEEPPGVFVFMQGVDNTYPPKFIFVAPESTDPIEVAAYWQLGLAMAKEALKTELPSMGIAIQTFGHELYEDPFLHVGECIDLIPPTRVDRSFLADLIVSRVDLPEVAAGHCIGFAHP